MTLPPGLISTPGTLGGAVRIGGRRITTEFIRQLYIAGEAVADIAGDYDLTVDQVRLALDYEGVDRA